MSSADEDVARSRRSAGLSYPVAHLEGDIVWASDLADAGVRPPGLECVGCKNTMSLRHGTRYRPHFAHRKSVECFGSESVLHQISKRVIGDAIRDAVAAGRSYPARWRCDLCEAEHATELAVGTVEVEASLGPVRPDLTVRDASGDVAAVVEVVVTHEPDEVAADWYRARQIPVLEVSPSWDSLEELRREITCSAVHQDVPPEDGDTQLAHRDGSGCGDLRELANRRASDAIVEGFKRARRSGSSYVISWHCGNCDREQDTDLARLCRFVEVAPERGTRWPPLWFADDDGLLVVVEFDPPDDVTLARHAPERERVVHARVPLQTNASFDGGFAVERAWGLDEGPSDAFVRRHLGGTHCHDTGARAATRQAIADGIDAARRAGDRYPVRIGCDICDVEREVNLASPASVGAVTVDVDFGGQRSDVALLDTNGQVRMVLLLSPLEHAQYSWLGGYDRASPETIEWFSERNIAVLEIGVRPGQGAAGGVNVLEAHGVACRHWRHPELPEHHTCHCGAAVRSLSFEIARGAECPGCKRAVPVLDIVETFESGWREAIRASDPTLVGIVEQTKHLPVVLKRNSTRTRDEYLMHHCPTCGFKIGDHFQYDDSRHRRLIAGTEVSHRLLCTAGHWTTVRSTTIPRPAPGEPLPRRYISGLPD